MEGLEEEPAPLYQILTMSLVVLVKEVVAPLDPSGRRFATRS